MNSSILRKIRIAVSLLFFAFTTLAFVDIFNITTPGLLNKIVFLQFVPSLLKYVTVLSLTTFGFIVVLLLTILFGRVYCSTICPLGVMQDIINFISGKIKRKKKRRFDYLKEQKYMRYILLVLPIASILLGSALAINLLDPYSIYGRIAGNFIRPAVIGANNVLASVLESVKVYSVYQYEIKAFNPYPFIITAAFFALVFVMAWKKGRLYCNTICPVGTLLGFISKFSLFQIVINDAECLKCGACARECKASCIDSKNKKVDMSRCVGCFNCLTSCPTEGITYSIAYKRNSTESKFLNQSKRDFFVKSAVYLSSISFIAAQVAKKIVVTKPSTIAIFRKNAITPPGSKSIDEFNNKCTACHLCVSACPTQVLQPSFLEYGFMGMLQPRLNNSAGFCNFECKNCSDVCPTGAILPLTIENKKLTQIGKVKFVKDNCIVQTQKTDCGACSEHCPTKAVHMIPFEGKLFIPEIRDKYCIGCGACEYACPVIPYKAIYVEGNSVHVKAELNLENKEEQKVNLTEDFPF